MLELLGVWLFYTATFLFYQTFSIFGGDAGDLVSAACSVGIPHPPGFPLYTILGVVAQNIGLYTPAWRVSLVSSIPSAITILVAYVILKKITKSRLAAFVGSATMAFSYLFWLYAEVPEVFALNNCFLISLLFLAVLMIEKISLPRLRVFAFLAGLSASHHHFSFWFYPVFGFYVWLYNKEYWKKNWLKSLVSLGLFFSLGLLPYLYFPLAAFRSPVISWSSPINWQNFWHLVTRADYGTFLSHGGTISVSLGQRALVSWGQVLMFGEYFGWLGYLFLIFGLVYLYKEKRKYFWLLGSLVFFSVLFIFYAGFSVNSQSLFTVGIVERFFLPGVLFGGLTIGFGIYYFVLIIADFASRTMPMRALTRKKLFTLVLFFMVIYPVGLFIKNSRMIYAIKHDQTAENYARDILKTVPQNGILMLSLDNPLFNTQYVHYCLGERPDVDIFHLSVNERDYYYDSFKKNFKNAVLPERGDADFVNKYLELNYKNREIYTNYLSHFKKGAFIPVGLLFKYYPDPQGIPSTDEVVKINHEAWSKYTNPSFGILSFFRPSILAAIPEDYSDAAKNLGSLLFESGKIKESKEFFEKAVSFNDRCIECFVYLGRVNMDEGACREAEKNLLIAAEGAGSSLPYYYLAQNAKLCLKDEQSYKQYQNMYLEKKKLEEGSLEDL